MPQIIGFENTFLYSSWPVEDSQSPAGEGEAVPIYADTSQRDGHNVIVAKVFCDAILGPLSHLMPALHLLVVARGQLLLHIDLYSGKKW